MEVVIGEIPAAAAAAGAAGGVMQPTRSQVLAALHNIQTSLPRYRPLARVARQLLGDLAALLSGLRVVIMLDYAPGTSAQQLAAALATLGETLPQWQGCVLELDGCYYLADSSALLEHLSHLAADAPSWPVLVNFQGTAAHVMLECMSQLQQQVQQLHAAVRSVLLPNAEFACSSSSGAAGCRHTGCQGANVAAAGPGPYTAAGASRLPCVRLGTFPGLPAMPMLNGLLLGYPVVYVVDNEHEAMEGSRVLSSSRLLLHRVTAKCSSQLEALLCAAEGPANQTGRLSQTCDTVTLMSFTVPEDVSGPSVSRKVQEVVSRLQQRRAQHDVLCAVQCAVDWVGPQAVSL